MQVAVTAAGDAVDRRARTRVAGRRRGQLPSTGRRRRRVVIGPRALGVQAPEQPCLIGVQDLEVVRPEAEGARRAVGSRPELARGLPLGAVVRAQRELVGVVGVQDVEPLDVAAGHAGRRDEQLAEIFPAAPGAAGPPAVLRCSVAPRAKTSTRLGPQATAAGALVTTPPMDVQPLAWVPSQRSVQIASSVPRAKTCASPSSRHCATTGPEPMLPPRSCQVPPPPTYRWWSAPRAKTQTAPPKRVTATGSGPGKPRSCHAPNQPCSSRQLSSTLPFWPRAAMVT